MKSKNIIIITNLQSSDKAMLVQNFSDDNVKVAIGKLLDIKPKDLKCETASMGGGIYLVTKKYRGLKDELKQIEGLRNQGDEVLIQVSYGNLFE